jgi:hypothetical protein
MKNLKMLQDLGAKNSTVLSGTLVPYALGAASPEPNLFFRCSFGNKKQVISAGITLSSTTFIRLEPWALLVDHMEV